MSKYIKSMGILYLLFFSLTVQASALNQLWITDPVLGSRAIVYEKVNGYAVVEGDILLGKIADMSNSSAVIRTKVGGSTWPHGIVAYEIADNMPFMNKLAIFQAMDHWQKHSRIKFVELTTKNSADYQDYISFIPAEGTTCASFVGRHGGRQVIQLSPRCTTMNTVHELGHALGMWHEQSRTDRDYFVRIAWENIQEDHKYNFNQHLTDGKDFGEYDYNSIMHYGAYAFSKNGKQTVIPLVPGAEIGQRNHLSEKDIAAINAMYPEW